MKLYLSSYYLGSNPEKLKEVVSPGAKVAIISNAGDYKSEDEKTQRWIDSQIKEFTELGYTAEQLDLRDYFDGNQELLANKLSEYGMVWLTGGNSFLLRKAMRQSGFDKIISPMVMNNEIVYGGFSAGACVATPTLHGIDKCDEPDLSVEKYDAETIWEGLGFVPFSIVPHYKSNHHETHLMDGVIEELERRSLPYKNLRDGEIIIINK